MDKRILQWHSLLIGRGRGASAVLWFPKLRRLAWAGERFLFFHNGGDVVSKETVPTLIKRCLKLLILEIGVETKNKRLEQLCEF
jgi:hypothetical protein